MKKVFTVTPSKLVRRVLSRTSHISSTEETKTNQTQASTSKSTKNEQDFTALETQLTSLREQISMLQVAVHNMEEEADNREKTLASIAREKQQLSIDLRKEIRSTSCLRQQLQDEREFYYKEKEQYCQEMNDCKKLKKKITENIESAKKEIAKDESADIIQYKSRISRLQDALNQTLQTNYNLSVKFMRMKNTKSHLKNQFRQQEEEHKEAMLSLQTAVNNIKNDLAEVVDKRFKMPISPSNKKYLQVIKQNGILMYENLCLQMEVDRLNAEIQHHKCSQKIPKRKLKEVQSSPQQNIPQRDDYAEEAFVTELHSHDKARSENQIQKPQSSRKILKDKHQPSTSTHQQPSTSTYQQTKKDPKNKEVNPKVITIFERASETPSRADHFRNTREKKTESKATNISRNRPVSRIPSTQAYTTASEISSNVVQTGSNTCTYTTNSSSTILRTQSAPEIVQCSLFVSKYKP